MFYHQVKGYEDIVAIRLTPYEYNQYMKQMLYYVAYMCRAKRTLRHG